MNYSCLLYNKRFKYNSPGVYMREIDISEVLIPHDFNLREEMKCFNIDVKVKCNYGNT